MEKRRIRIFLYRKAANKRLDRLWDKVLKSEWKDCGFHKSERYERWIRQIDKNRSWIDDLENAYHETWGAI